jgi:hypothetical protein
MVVVMNEYASAYGAATCVEEMTAAKYNFSRVGRKRAADDERMARAQGRDLRSMLRAACFRRMPVTR